MNRRAPTVAAIGGGGNGFFCRKQLWSCCDNSYPNAWMAEKLYGYSTSGLFGYSHLTGGYAGGQAEYARVPFADVGPLKIPSGITDEQAIFLSDIFPTGYMAAENCNIQPGDTIAVWGCGPVGQFAIRSARMLGAEQASGPMPPVIIERGDIDPSFVITHKVPLDKAADMYCTFRDKQDECIKVVLKPGESAATTVH